MAEKSRGSMHGSRKKFKRGQRDKTKVNDFLKEFEKGDTVLIKMDPSVQSGRSHSRFHGKNAVVTGERGDAYELEIKDGGQTKTLYMPAVHLQETGE